MPALGHNGSLNMVKEVTYGVNPGSGYTSQLFTGENMITKQAFIEGKPIGANRQAPLQMVTGALSAAGGWTFDGNTDSCLGMVLKGLLSAETYTSNGAGNGGTHVFLPQNVVPPSYTVLLNRDNLVGPAANVWAYTGTVIDELDFSATDGKFLTVGVKATSQNGQPGATASAPSYTSDMPLVYSQGIMSVGGVGMNMKSMKLNIKGGIYNKRGILGSPLIIQQQPGLLEVSGTIEAYFDSLAMTELQNYLAGTPTTLSLEFLGAAIGSYQRSITFLVPVCQFQGDTPNLKSASAETMVSLKFKAWLSGAGSPNDLVQITLVNATQSAY